MIVVDASVVVDHLLGPGSPAGDRFADELRAGTVLTAPHLLDVEVAQVLRRYSLRGDLDEDRTTVAVGEAGRLPIHRYPHRPLTERAFELRANVTVYDGVYLALAELLDAPLLTADAALGDVPGCAAIVQVVVAD